MKTHGMQNLHLQNQRIQMENAELKQLIQSIHQHYNPGMDDFDIGEGLKELRKQNLKQAKG